MTLEIKVKENNVTACNLLARKYFKMLIAKFNQNM